MLPTEVLSRILAVRPVLDAVERDQAAPRAAFEHLLIGQAVTGQVKGQSKGLTLVSIEGQTVAMRLPHPVATGDTLKLNFAGHMPQPVFLLDTPETTQTDAPQLSQTARMLSEIMQRVPERSLPTLTPLTPLLDQPTRAPAELALALRTALVRSGLFYESHLANWAVGLDSLDGLMQEPQNRMATHPWTHRISACARIHAGCNDRTRSPQPRRTRRRQNQPTRCTLCWRSNYRCWNPPNLSGAANCGRGTSWNGKCARKPTPRMTQARLPPTKRTWPGNPASNSPCRTSAP